MKNLKGGKGESNAGEGLTLILTTNIWPSLTLNWVDARTEKADGMSRSYTYRSKPGKA